MKRSLPSIISHIGRANGTSGQPYWSLLTVVLLVFVAGPRTIGEEIVPFKPEMEPLKRFAEELGSICGEDGRIWKAEGARRVEDNANRERPRRKTRCRNPVPDTVVYARTSIVLYKDTAHIALREYFKPSKDKMGRGQNVLIVANICRIKLNGGYASSRT